MEKVYLALLSGEIEGEGRIDTALKKTSSAAAGWRMTVDPAGKPAQTDWRALRPHAAGTLVEFRPHTGRTHQIRIHAAHALAPIAGDPVYGEHGGQDGGRMRLHAARIAFLWRGGRRVEVEAPLPDWAR